MIDIESTGTTDWQSEKLSRIGSVENLDMRLN